MRNGGGGRRGGSWGGGLSSRRRKACSLVNKSQRKICPTHIRHNTDQTYGSISAWLINSFKTHKVYPSP